MPADLNIHVILRDSAMPSDGWRMLAIIGDQWMCAYLRMGVHGESILPSPWFFAGGHALELYLKAAVARTSTVDEAVGYRHRMRELWTAAHQITGFPISLELRAHLLSREILFGDVRLKSQHDTLSRDDRLHLSLHQGLYRAIGHVQHLKYLGVPGQATPETSGYAFIYPDTDLIRLLDCIRAWLGHSSGADEEIAALVRRYLE